MISSVGNMLSVTCPGGREIQVEMSSKLSGYMCPTPGMEDWTRGGDGRVVAYSDGEWIIRNNAQSEKRDTNIYPLIPAILPQIQHV